VTLRYLPEHADAARLALDLAEREASYLAYSQRTLFSLPIDLQWVEALPARDDLAEKIDAFVSRFARLQDHIGDKLIPRFARLLGESPRSLLDALAYAERMEWIESAEAFIGARRLRNLLVHEYMSNSALFLEALRAADSATRMLLSIVAKLRDQALRLGLPVIENKDRAGPRG
jgi:hypothetical protein